MCGVVDGGIVAGLWGYEAGQSGVGDIFAWFVEHQRARRRTHAEAAERGLDRARAPHRPRRRAGRSASTAWSPSTGTAATARSWSTTSCPGCVVGQTLATRAEDIYRALLEATAFGTRMIVETFDDAGVPVTELVVAGGLLKNPLLMQIYADVTRPAAVDDRLRAGPGARLGDPRRGRRRRLPRRRAPPPRRWAASTAASTSPIPANVAALRRAVRRVPSRLHDYFGRGGNDVMHRLGAPLRREAAS